MKIITPQRDENGNALETEEVGLATLEIPDLYNIGAGLSESPSLVEQAAGHAVIDLWHLAHNLKRKLVAVEVAALVVASLYEETGVPDLNDAITNLEAAIKSAYRVSL
jgi:hypothetical protein